MAFDLEEQEKIDELKAWWNRFGGLVSGVATVIMLAILGYYGWNWYQGYQSQKALGYYDIINTSVMAPDQSSAARIIEANGVLQKDYGSTVYAPRAALLASKFFLDMDNAAEAEKQLQWAVTQKTDPSLVPAAQLQLATALADQEKYDQALAQLSNPPAAFKALFLDRQGDILIAQGKAADAVKAWQEAKAAAGLDDSLVRTVDLKISVLGGE